MIRPYVSQDAERIIHIWRKASEFAHPFLSDNFHDMAATAIRDIYLPKAETYVTEINGVAVGFISLLDNYIGGLFLDPQYHGRGLGRALVGHAVKQKGPLTVEVFKENARGRRFYAANGFVPTEEYFHEQAQHISIKMTMKP
ncbi:GNAT family N-acetyltransferase [Roseibium sp.]|uniref:GNAT family N-acetyltransferase n=1 Tax=Roseibium sp. TaxID=1936156 RepID=UPI001B14DEA6|nr:GNAT family N-acetyltransferase [Roseibium sp.]MBO6859336.1 GNAT family N-acetyltransferase [Roseibium sp.]